MENSRIDDLGNYMSSYAIISGDSQVMQITDFHVRFRCIQLLTNQLTVNCVFECRNAFTHVPVVELLKSFASPV